MEQELRYLQTVRWIETEEMIREAKRYGDLPNNAECEFAMTEQAKCRERIDDIKYILSHAVITDEAE